eukprot:TRINITY_DN9726_c3_g1_i1.p1 TRINITY_DN9726_c3_g1~~TRINITY_DN9726_c3_g1_i1.p1  ORF type:complete len:887 (-),score=256.52 TRINITY_DN9726_c3_g1_i1:85-2745(-)
MRAVCAVLALLVVGAFAQDFSHIVGGSFSRGDLVNTANGLARWDTATKKWTGTSSPALGLDNIIDVEAATSDILYLLTSSGGVTRVVQYTISKESWQIVGEEASGGNSFNDITIVGDRLYVCGSFTFQRGVAEGQTPSPNVVNVASVPVASDQARPLWTAVPAPTTPGATAPPCSRLWGFGTRLVIRSGNQLVWKANNNDWVSDPSSTDIAGGSGSNIRNSAGTAGPVSFSSWSMEGTTLYIHSGAGFTLSPDTTTIYRVVYSADGVTWTAALRFDETALNNDPRRYTADLSSFVVKSGEVFFFASRSNGTRTYWAMHKASVSSQAIGVDRAQTRLSTGYIGNGQNANDGSSPVAGAGMWFVDNKIVFACRWAVCVNYTEVSYADSENDDPNLVLYRSATYLGQFVGFENGVYSYENAGGLTADNNNIVNPTKVLKGDGTAYWFVGGFTRAWNKRWLGLAGYNQKNKEWVGLGDPLQDWLRFPDSIDGSNDPTGNALTAGGINTIHHFPVDNGAVAVITAGAFRRIGNATYNGIAWMRTDKIGDWNALGSIGLHSAASTHTKTITKNGNPVGTNFYLRPGTVHAIASTTHKAKGKNGRTLWIGGEFLGTGAIVSETVLNNVARYSFGDENDKTFTSMQGGVNGAVYAIDAVGPLVFVGGAFTRAGNVTVNNIAMWDDDKQTWSHMQTGVAGTVRQIWAESANDVWVVLDTGVNLAGGAKNVRAGNIFRWDGSRWTTFNCDPICDNYCESRNQIATGCGGDQTVELRRVGNNIIRRSATGGLLTRDGGRWRNVDASVIGSVDNTFKDMLSRPLAGGNRVLVAGFTGTGDGLADKYTPYLAELDLGNDNVYPVVGAGFDGPIAQLSSASSFAPALAVLALALIAALLL